MEPENEVEIFVRFQDGCAIVTAFLCGRLAEREVWIPPDQDGRAVVTTFLQGRMVEREVYNGRGEEEVREGGELPGEL